MIVGLVLLISLGTWQYGRYHIKLGQETTRDQQKTKEAITVSSISSINPRTMAYRRLRIRGTFDNARSVLFRHRNYKTKPGYWVGSPLILSDGEDASKKEVLWVNRGWVPKQLGRDFLKKLSKQQATTQTYEGLLHVPDKIVKDRRTRLGIKNGQKSLLNGRLELASYDLDMLQAQTAQKTPDTPMILVLDSKHSGSPMPIASLTYLTKPYMTSDRHMSYFIFWYAMAVVLFGLYMAHSLGLIRAATHPTKLSIRQDSPQHSPEQS